MLNLPKKPLNIFSVDVEEIRHQNFPSIVPKKRLVDKNIEENVTRLVELFAKHNAFATFFFLGEVAAEYPSLVRLVKNQGHEIASHGFGHELVYKQNRRQFFEDVKKSLWILQDITGLSVKGYRAPSWSISNVTPWAYEVLLELGLEYDASVFPFNTYIYGDGSAPVSPHFVKVRGRNFPVMPATVMEMRGIRLPFGGGFYLRAYPFWVTRILSFMVNRNDRPVVFYVHPREIDPVQVRIQMNLRDYFFSYFNLSGTFSKLDGLLRLGQTITIYDYLKNNGWLIDSQ